MVGVLMRQGQSHAIIVCRQDAPPGSRSATISGRITGRSRPSRESEVTLKELVEDAGGEWTERISTLQLQEQAPQEAKK